MTIKLCSKCHDAPTTKSNGYCSDCNRVYQREYARRVRGCKPRPMKPVLQPGEKFCTKCARTLPIERFSRSKSKSDGRMSMCKECDYLRGSIWRDKNRAYVRKRDRVYAHKWRIEHPNYDREWNQKHPGIRKRKRLEKKLRIAGSLS